MTKVKVLEEQIQKLSPKELSELRDWFIQFSGDHWDEQFALDVKTGKLNALGDKALAAHAAGKTKPL